MPDPCHGWSLSLLPDDAAVLDAMQAALRAVRAAGLRCHWHADTGEITVSPKDRATSARGRTALAALAPYKPTIVRIMQAHPAIGVFLDPGERRNDRPGGSQAHAAEGGVPILDPDRDPRTGAILERNTAGQVGSDAAETVPVSTQEPERDTNVCRKESEAGGTDAAHPDERQAALFST